MHFWYHVDITADNYESMIADATVEHAKHAPGSQLSINTHLDETEALVKISAADDYAPGWASTPLVIRRFTVADHDEAREMVTTVEWAGEFDEEDL